jgi:hypothetical protein
VPSMRIDRITLLPELQFREDSRNQQGLANPERVQEYAEAMERGEDFPPVRVVEDGQTRWLVDGFHTLAAYTRLGKTMVPAEVIEGDLETAHREAWKANARRGAEYTPGDKRNKLLDLFRWQEWYEKPVRDVASLTGISYPFCSKVRQDAPPPEFVSWDTNSTDSASEEESDQEGTEEVPPKEQPKRKRGRPPGGTAAKKSRKRRQQAAPAANGSQESDGKTESGDEEALDTFTDAGTDALDRPIPPALAPVFASRKKFREARLLVRRLNAILTEVATSPGGAHLARDLSRRESQGRVYYRSRNLEDFDAALKFHEPYSALCPWCEQEHPGRTDRSCKACFGLGWVSCQLWKQAPAEYRAAAERSPHATP